MTTKVLPFASRAEGQTNIPTPVYHQIGDEYLRLDIKGGTEDVGLFPGSVAIFRRGAICDGSIHLFTLRGEEIISRLLRHGPYVRVGADILKGALFPSLEVKIFGTLVEFYPIGLGGPRSITYQPERARILSPRHPERGMEYQLVNASSF